MDKADRKHTLTDNGDHPQYQGRDVQDHNRNQSRQQVVEQLHGFGRIGSRQVQEHIHRNDGLPEQIEQHDLKGPEEYEKE